MHSPGVQVMVRHAEQVATGRCRRVLGRSVYWAPSLRVARRLINRIPQLLRQPCIQRVVLCFERDWSTGGSEHNHE